jgi:hypothetical protein
LPGLNSFESGIWESRLPNRLVQQNVVRNLTECRVRVGSVHRGFGESVAAGEAAAAIAEA